MRTIKTCPGLGDVAWIFCKLLAANEQFRWEISDGKPQRGHQIFELLPQLSAACTYRPNMPYRLINENNVQRHRPLWYEIQDHAFYLSANEWLEQGNMLVDFFPDLPMAYKLPYQTAQWEIEVAEDFKHSTTYIGIYGSSYSTARSWGFWEAEKWVSLIKLIHAERPHAVFCIIGAAWDVNLSDDIVHLLTLYQIPFINTVGKPLGYVIELMKIMSYAFYFPSGLPIISETLEGGCPCMMFYPPVLLKMMGTWSDPKRIEDLNFHETQFIEPQEAFDWAKDKYCLLDKI